MKGTKLLLGALLAAMLLTQTSCGVIWTGADCGCDVVKAVT